MWVTVKALVQCTRFKRASPARPHTFLAGFSLAIIMNIIFKNLLALLVPLNGH